MANTEFYTLGDDPSRRTEYCTRVFHGILQRHGRIRSCAGWVSRSCVDSQAEAGTPGYQERVSHRRATGSRAGAWRSNLWHHVSRNSMMNRLLVLNKLSWPLRIPIKWAVMGLTLLVVCFPHPTQLVRHIEHWRHAEALIEPNAVALEPLFAELHPLVAENQSPRKVLNIVERFVYKKIKYAWDWDTWGNADYMPTVTEAVEKGQEDCDGRAVVAASLLRRLGYNAQIVTDFAHVWVKTDQGETMGPGRKKAIVATKKGLSVQRGALIQLARGLAYSVAPFPLGRELILIVMFWWLLLRPKCGFGCGVVALLLLLNGLFFLRNGGANYREPVVWMQLLGLLNLTSATIGLLFWGTHNARVAQRTAGTAPADPRING